MAAFFYVCNLNATCARERMWRGLQTCATLHEKVCAEKNMQMRQSCPCSCILYIYAYVYVHTYIKPKIYCLCFDHILTCDTSLTTATVKHVIIVLSCVFDNDAFTVSLSCCCFSVRVPVFCTWQCDQCVPLSVLTPNNIKGPLFSRP